MIRAKVVYPILDRQAEIDEVMALPIGQVVDELKTIDMRKAELHAMKFAKVEELMAGIEAQFEDDKKRYFERGGRQDSIFYMKIVDDYQRALEGVESHPEVVAIQNELQKSERRKILLQEAKEQYKCQNAELLAEKKRMEQLDEIERVGLHNIMDDD